MTCKNNGILNTETQFCTCIGNYTGKYCQIYSEFQFDSMNKNAYKIVIQEKLDNTLEQNNEISIVMRTKDDKYILIDNYNMNYNITWKILLNETDIKELYSDKMFLNYEFENIFSIQKQYLKLNGEYKIICSILDIIYGTTINLKMNYTINSFNIDEIKIEIENESNLIYAMQTKYNIIIKNYCPSTYKGFNYKFFYYDENNNKLPLTTYSSKTSYSLLIPYTKLLILAVIDDSGNYKEKNIDISNTVLKNLSLINDIKTEIINSSLYENLEKLHLLKNFFDKDNNNIATENQMLALISYLKKLLNNTIELNIKSGIFNIILSLLSDIIINTNYKNYIYNISDILYTSIDLLEEKEYYLYYNETISYFSTLNSILKTTTSSNQFDNIINYISKLNYQILKTNLVAGESLYFEENNFKVLNIMPSKYQKGYNIEDLSLLSFNPRTIDFNINNQCYKNYNSFMFCMDNSNDLNLRNTLNNLLYNNDNNISYVNMSYSFLEINGKIITNIFAYYKEKKFKYNLNNLRELKEYQINSFKYFLSFKIDYNSNLEKDYFKKTSCLSSDMIDSNNQIIVKNTFCGTYFNYEQKRIICECNNSGEIAFITNEKLTKSFRQIQYPEKDYSYVNWFSLTVLLSLIIIIIVISLVLLFLDYKDEYQQNYSKNEHLILFYKNNYNIKDMGIFKLTLFSNLYDFPYFNVFYYYDLNIPRILRFLTKIFHFLISLLISSLPFYFMKFSKRNDFIYRTDFKLYGKDSYAQSIKILDIILTLIYIIIFSSFFYWMIYLKLNFIELNFLDSLKNYWKQNFKNIHNLIEENCIDFNFNKFKIKGFNLIVGDYLLNNKKIEENEINSNNNKNKKNLILNDTKTTELLILSPSKSSKLKENMLSHNNLLLNSENNFLLKSNINLKIENIILFSCNKNKFLFIKNNNKKNYKINNKENKNNTINKVNKFKNLEIKYNTNFTILNIISNNYQTNNKKLNNKKKIIIVIIIVIILNIICLISLFFILTKLYNKYYKYIVKCWFIPSIIILIFLYLIFNICKLYIYHLYISKNLTKNMDFICKYFISKYLIFINLFQKLIIKHNSKINDEIKKLQNINDIEMNEYESNEVVPKSSERELNNNI